MPSGFFSDAYSSRPPWDIGRPQPVFVRLAEGNEIVGPVLDVGCGTGENALYLAARGFEVTGVDAVKAAIAAARDKARSRGLDAAFIVHDALDLGTLGVAFTTVIDSGLFHSFEDDEREPFRRSLAAALRRGGRYFMLGFSDRETRSGGPRRLRRAEIEQVFDRPPFRVLSIEPAEMATLLEGEGRHGWLARVERVAGS
jgi:cyclopropane fatty-acyl-phospholipid synthase-like methyltransferase